MYSQVCWVYYPSHWLWVEAEVNVNLYYGCWCPGVGPCVVAGAAHSSAHNSNSSPPPHYRSPGYVTGGSVARWPAAAWRATSRTMAADTHPSSASSSSSAPWLAGTSSPKVSPAALSLSTHYLQPFFLSCSVSLFSRDNVHFLGNPIDT